jgi:hypothetical protein
MHIHRVNSKLFGIQGSGILTQLAKISRKIYYFCNSIRMWKFSRMPLVVFISLPYEGAFIVKSIFKFMITLQYLLPNPLCCLQISIQVQIGFCRVYFMLWAQSHYWKISTSNCPCAKLSTEPLRCKGERAYSSTILTMALDGSQWSVSCLWQFTSGGRAPWTLSIGWSVGNRPIWICIMEKKNLALAKNWTQAIQPTVIVTELPQLCLHTHMLAYKKKIIINCFKKQTESNPFIFMYHVALLYFSHTLSQNFYGACSFDFHKYIRSQERLTLATVLNLGNQKLLVKTVR